MARLRLLSLANPYLPLTGRAGLIMACALATSVRSMKSSPPVPSPSSAVLPALLLLLLAALASVPLPQSIPTLLQPVTEALAASALVGALGDRGGLFRPYLLAPVIVAGVMLGARAAVSISLAAAAALGIAAAAVAPTSHAQLTAAVGAAAWAPILLAAGLLAALARRLRGPGPLILEPAYANAHRLLSELHVVARQLSLGLDPQTLARALLDEVKSVVAPLSATVLVRSPGGLFVPVVGDEPAADTHSAIHDAWITGDTVRRVRRESTIIAIPVVMGLRVVALVVLTLPRGRESLDEATMRACRQAVDHSGPRLATAMLFDDVRRLATVDERMRLAREIHDGIAQDLASVGYVIDDIARDADGQTALRLGELRDHLGSMVTELRLSIFDLRAGVDDVVGLGTAISEYVQRVGSQSGLVVHVLLDENPQRLPTAVEVELLRILQEAVTNVRRHAAASNIWLSLTVDPPRARLTIEDDGRGLQTPRPDSVGITGMRERTRRIGGRLHIGTSDKGGTLVEVIIDGSRNLGEASEPLASAR